MVRKATWIKLKRALFKKIFINHQILKKSIHFKAQNVAKKTSGTEERIKMKECKLFYNRLRKTSKKTALHPHFNLPALMSAIKFNESRRSLDLKLIKDDVRNR